jgi:dimethylhistidine N-methyltransferase
MKKSALKKRPLAADEENPFLRDVLAGMSAQPKWMAAKHFYDAEGSRLFDEITKLSEYYTTRSETEILRNRAHDIAALVPDGAALVEFGAGSNAKIRLILKAAPKIAAYVPVDISAEYLREQASALGADFPKLKIFPVAEDFTKCFALPEKIRTMPKLGFFPGSTIGNFEPLAAVKFLRNAAKILGANATLLIGVDLVKDEKVLNAAYNDEAGITAAFNLNLLSRINRETGADFDVEAFEHRAFFNTARERIEMHLVSRKKQTVKVAGRAFAFEEGETIHTENSYKYSREGFRDLARQAGWTETAFWTDAAGNFSVRALKAKG